MNRNRSPADFQSLVNSVTPSKCISNPSRRLRAPRHGLLTACAIAASALLVAGCGGSSSPKTTTTSGSPLAVTTIERAIELSIQKQHGVATVVTCPTNAPRRAGYRFTCTAALDVGTYPVSVLEVNARGGVTYSNSAPLDVVDSSRVAKAIEDSIRSQRRLSAAVTCPATILEAKGLTFTCTAKTRKGTGAFRVTETNSYGHVTFVGL
jgi:hypothetical protein